MDNIRENINNLYLFIDKISRYNVENTNINLDYKNKLDRKIKSEDKKQDYIFTDDIAKLINVIENGDFDNFISILSKSKLTLFYITIFSTFKMNTDLRKYFELYLIQKKNYFYEYSKKNKDVLYNFLFIKNRDFYDYIQNSLDELYIYVRDRIREIGGYSDNFLIYKEYSKSMLVKSFMYFFINMLYIYFILYYMIKYSKNEYIYELKSKSLISSNTNKEIIDIIYSYLNVSNNFKNFLNNKGYNNYTLDIKILNRNVIISLRKRGLKWMWLKIMNLIKQKKI